MHSCNGGWCLSVGKNPAGEEVAWTGGGDGTVRGLMTRAWVAHEQNRGTGLQPGVPEGTALIPYRVAAALQSARNSVEESSKVEASSHANDYAMQTLLDLVRQQGGGCAVDVSLLHGGSSAMCATSINGIFAMASLPEGDVGAAGQDSKQRMVHE